MHADARLQAVVLVLHSAGAGKVEVVVFPERCRGCTRALWGLGVGGVTLAICSSSRTVPSVTDML